MWWNKCEKLNQSSVCDKASTFKRMQYAWLNSELCLGRFISAFFFCNKTEDCLNFFSVKSASERKTMSEWRSKSIDQNTMNQYLHWTWFVLENQVHIFAIEKSWLSMLKNWDGCCTYCNLHAACERVYSDGKPDNLFSLYFCSIGNFLEDRLPRMGVKSRTTIWFGDEWKVQRLLLDTISNRDFCLELRTESHWTINQYEINSIIDRSPRINEFLSPFSVIASTKMHIKIVVIFLKLIVDRLTCEYRPSRCC